jgi:hypothetical protein
VGVESDPPGAHVILDGKDSGKLTPAQLDLDSGRTAEVVLRKEGFLDQRLTVTGPQAGERAVFRASLPLSPVVAALTVEVEPPGANVTVDGLALFPPAPSHDTFVKPDVPHVIKAGAPGFVEQRAELSLHGGEHQTLRWKLVEGGLLQLKTRVAAHLFIDDKLVGSTPIAALALAQGRHSVGLRAERPFLRYDTTITVEKGRTVEKALDFGTVEVKIAGVVAHPAGAGARGVTELLLLAGPQTLALSNKEGETKERELVVEPGGKLVVDAW